ncbi:3-hydroxyanthranilic acid dioxygenase [Exophiala xenobiotica]|uniref:3-hydroxyanthranilate 3,4-dioxygenase n=1 Tax=Lithohypha guttulata TaxID=1690604 RepID=A0ABR0K6V0_9EURO|nr:3-hydroxyanthranilic acid dioxygenase [Lithohypha guttulata]KAK5314648.1 3-hydroxyanthranilic acid dioxygenase [Exophiala xenobiotica]
MSIDAATKRRHATLHTLLAQIVLDVETYETSDGIESTAVPPVNNYCVYHPSSPDTSGLTVMVVGGPNARTDYHINETPEFFYQHKGSMLLKTVDTSKTPHAFVDIPIHEHSLYLLPANTPHNPVRFADTVGVVLEQARPAESIDKMRWYCKNPDCRQVVHEAAFHCNDLGSQIKNAVQAFEKNMDARTCKNCGTVNDSKPAPGEIKQPPRFPD